MNLYFKYLKIHLNSQLQYRASFLLMTFGQFFVPFFAYAAVYVMFERFNNINGWNFYEVALCFAVIHMTFAISECFARGFDSFSTLIRKGEFDRVLTRPRNTVIQVFGSKFEFNRFGRLIQSIIVLIWSLLNLNIYWTLGKAVVLILMIFSGVFIFTGIFILVATFCFWTIDGLEVANILTYGGREMCQYPLDIYRQWVTRFFTFVIPLGCINYLPLLYLLGKTNGYEWLYMLTPVFGMLFIIPCLFVWKIGVRSYLSTGS